MNFKARFERKASAPQVTDADIVGVVTLNQEQFAWFSERLLDDYDFIADYAKETYDDGERKHCLLVLGEGEDDGILVCSEGSFYARYSAYLPKARQILRDEIHRVAELMIKGRFGDIENGSWVIGFDDIKEHSKASGTGLMYLPQRSSVSMTVCMEHKSKYRDARHTVSGISPSRLPGTAVRNSGQNGSMNRRQIPKP